MGAGKNSFDSHLEYILLLPCPALFANEQIQQLQPEKDLLKMDKSRHLLDEYLNHSIP